MRCPKCKADNVKVVISKPTYYSVKRRRKCLDCNFAFSTIEILTNLTDELLECLWGDVNETDEA